MNLIKIFSYNRNLLHLHKSSKKILHPTRFLNAKHYAISTSLQSTQTNQQQKNEWSRAVSEAERIVGYPTSFLSLRWLLSDEIANVALHLRRIVGSNHPLLRTAKNLLNNNKNNMQAWGLIVLLLSKAAGQCKTVPDLEQDKAAGVLHSQRALAEVTEMIRTAFLVHKGLVNMQTCSKEEMEAKDDLTFGNKIALLSGDYLLGNSAMQLANLRNAKLVEMMSSASRDLAEAEFVGRRDEQNNPLPSPPRELTDKNEAILKAEDVESPETNDMSSMETTEEELREEEIISKYESTDGNGSENMDEWTRRHVLAAGNLLGKACEGAVTLAGHPYETQYKSFLFGKHLALAWQSGVELEPFMGTECPPITSVGPGSPQPFSLASAPVIYTLQEDPSLYVELERGAKSIWDVDYETIWYRVKHGPGIDKTRELQAQHSQLALDVLEHFPYSDARKALVNIIVAMQEV